MVSTRRSANLAATAVTATMMLVGAAGAVEVTVTASQDNSIFQVSPENSNGAGPNIFSGRTGASGGNSILRGLFEFDLSSIPAGATITDVEVTLALIQAGPLSGVQSHTLHRVTSGWGEGTSSSFGGTGVAATPGDATWQHTFYDKEFWASEGGDFVGGASASQSVGTTPGLITWTSTPDLVADVQAWVDDPSSNHGWMVRGNEVSTFTAKKFASRENQPCSTDITGPLGVGVPDGNVDSLDFLVLIGQWGTPCNPGPICEADVTGIEKSPDGNVDALDYLAMIAQWGSPGNCVDETNAPKVTITYTAP
jgi:hypothetical protein